MNTMYDGVAGDILYDTPVVELYEKPKKKANLPYPHLKISGLSYTPEVNFIKTRVFSKSCALPLYLEFEDEVLFITNMDLTTKSLLVLKGISEGSYKLTLYKDEDNSVDIDYTDGSTLEKFIKLGGK